MYMPEEAAEMIGIVDALIGLALIGARYHFFKNPKSASGATTPLRGDATSHRQMIAPLQQTCELVVEVSPEADNQPAPSVAAERSGLLGGPVGAGDGKAVAVASGLKDVAVGAVGLAALGVPVEHSGGEVVQVRSDVADPARRDDRGQELRDLVAGGGHGEGEYVLVAA
jgi:hypothetical protein